MKRTNTLVKSILNSANPLKVKRIENRMIVAQMFYDYLNVRGISQQALALKMGKQASEISKWLSGNHNFTIDTLSDIGFYLDVNFFVRRESPMFKCKEHIEIKHSKVRMCKFEPMQVNQFKLSLFVTNNNSERCPA